MISILAPYPDLLQYLGLNFTWLSYHILIGLIQLLYSFLKPRLIANRIKIYASEYVFRTSTQIETASRDLAWLNKGVFISVGGRGPGGVIYETYLVA